MSFLLWWIAPGLALAWEPDRLLIWINGDKGYAGIAEIGRIFTQNTGIPVVVEHPEGATDKFSMPPRAARVPIS